MNRKQRRAEEKAGGPQVRAPGLLEETLFRQALTHHQAGRLQEAEAGYRAVLNANARHTGALGSLGLLAYQLGHRDAGIDLLRKAIASDKRDPEPHYNLARLLSDSGRDDEAIVHNRKALELNPNYPGAHNNLAALLLLRGRASDALAVASDGLRFDESAGLKSTFVMAMQALDPLKIKLTTTIVHFLTRALTEPWCRPRDLAAVGAAVLLRTPAMVRAVERTPGAARLDDVFGADDLALLDSDGLLDALLTTSPVTTLALENLLTSIRRLFLNELETRASVPEVWLPLASAIARQSFINEYVFAVSDEEDRQLLKLRGSLTDALAKDAAVAPVALAVLASYLPLHMLPDAERLVSRDWPEPVRALVAQQVSEPGEERIIRDGIERLTAIDDAVSEKVRAQYEENPYPRLAKVFTGNLALPIDHYLRMRLPGAPYRDIGNRAIDVLVAGCGTGQHAIQRAMQFQQANVTAIDLSLSSLGYAIRKTKELGLTNVHYAQADILALNDDTTFDVIDSSGVLHHLRDPLEGWRKLAGLVRPGGLMHIGLYSEFARRDINAAREHLAQQGQDYSAANVHKLRAEIAARPASDPLHNVTQFSDFFSMSECRDLLFHVQEHQFSIPRIAAFLEEVGFTFLGFETPARASYLRRFPNDHAAIDLANWAAFEEEHPATFAQMYQFWIQKA